MPKPTVIECARRYIAKMEPGVQGNGRHNATVEAANYLLHGFALSEADAWTLLQEYNDRCQPPSSEAKLQHRFNVAKNFSNDQPCGWLILDEDSDYGNAGAGRSPAPPAPPRPPKPVYNETALQRFAGEWTDKVNLVWLANRSALDPATVDSDKFLQTLYGPREKVLIFSREFSQGNAIWPDEPIPKPEGRGLWYLAQPVDGEYHPNPRSVSYGGDPKLSRRSEESVTAFRYLVVESDEAPMREWIGALVQLPLRIAAIYSSGSRSVHALVQVDCPTKGTWDAVKLEMKAGLVTLGADPGAMSAVRLTRLPGCLREGKDVEVKAIEGGKRKEYHRYKKPGVQKLFYINPNPEIRPLTEHSEIRDVESIWTSYARQGIADTDETGGRWLIKGLSYYASASRPCREALKELKNG